jgi:hypothetical protein
MNIIIREEFLIFAGKGKDKGKGKAFLISNFRRVLYVVCFFLGNSPASEFYMPTFRNTLSVPSSKAGRCRMTTFYTYLPIKIKQTVFRKVGL